MFFLQAPVTGLSKAKLAFDDSKNVFNAGSDRRVFAVALSLAARQVFAGLAFVVDTPTQPQMPRAFFVIVAGVAGIVCEDDSIVFAQQLGQLHDVRGIGRRDGDAVHGARIDVSANVDLHTLWDTSAEIPLIAFLGLMHVGVALLILILG